MRKITAIKLQKRNNKCFNIYIDGEFAFGVSEDVLIRQKLKVGMVLSTTFIDEVILAEKQSKANNYALRLLGYRARSEHEIRSRLRLKGYEDPIIDNVVRFLKKYGYIDDYVFTIALVNDEINLKQSGKGLIKQKLFQKGVKREIIQKVLDETIDDDKSYQACMNLAKKKLNTTYRDDTETVKTRKITAFLQRKGYSYDMIRKVVEEILGNYEGKR